MAEAASHLAEIIERYRNELEKMGIRCERVLVFGSQVTGAALWRGQGKPFSSFMLTRLLGTQRQARYTPLNCPLSLESPLGSETEPKGMI
jgi:hypothetical protein